MKKLTKEEARNILKNLGWEEFDNERMLNLITSLSIKEDLAELNLKRPLNLVIVDDFLTEIIITAFVSGLFLVKNLKIKYFLVVEQNYKKENTRKIAREIFKKTCPKFVLLDYVLGPNLFADELFPFLNKKGIKIIGNSGGKDMKGVKFSFRKGENVAEMKKFLQQYC